MGILVWMGVRMRYWKQTYMEPRAIDEDMVFLMVDLQKLTCLLRTGFREVLDGEGIFGVLGGRELYSGFRRHTS